MKLRVIREFADKFDGTKIYNVGETLETDDQERVKDLTDRRLAEVIETDKTEGADSQKPKGKGQKPKGKGQKPKANGQKSKAADEATGDATEEAAGDAASESAGGAADEAAGDAAGESAGDAADEAAGDAAGDGDDNGNGGETASHSN